MSGWVGKGAVCVVRWARALARPTSIASSPPFASSRLCARVSLSSPLFSRFLALSRRLLAGSSSLSLFPPLFLSTHPPFSLSRLLTLRQSGPGLVHRSDGTRRLSAAGPAPLELSQTQQPRSRSRTVLSLVPSHRGLLL